MTQQYTDVDDLEAELASLGLELATERATHASPQCAECPNGPPDFCSECPYYKPPSCAAELDRLTLALAAERAANQALREGLGPFAKPASWFLRSESNGETFWGLVSTWTRDIPTAPISFPYTAAQAALAAADKVLQK